MAFDQDGQPVVPLGSVGFRWGQDGKWNLEAKESGGREVALTLTLAGSNPTARVSFPYFGGAATNGFKATGHGDVLTRNVPVRNLALRDGDTLVTTVFDLMCANYGLDRGLGGNNVATDYNEDKPFTPAWAENITGVPRHHIIHVAREFATNAEKTNGRSMVILAPG